MARDAEQVLTRLLTTEELAAFDRDGFLVIRSALADSLCEEIECASDEWIASGSTFNLDRVPETVSYRDCISRHPAFRRLIALGSVLPAMIQILGTNLRLLGTQVIYLPPVKEPERPDTTSLPGGFAVSGAGWHQDLYSVTRDFDPAALPRLAIKVMYYLNDCNSPDAGMTLFATGSHKIDRRSFKDGVDRNSIAAPVVRRGDAVMFENRTFHAAGFNLSAYTRKAVAFQYGFRWLAPLYDIDYTDDIVSQCTPIERQLLGATHDRNADGSIGRGGATQPLREWAREIGIPTNHK